MLLLAVSAAKLTAVACNRMPPPPPPPTLSETINQPTCRVTQSSDKPLIVEWPATDREELERRTLDGLVAARYENCELEIVRNCRVDGQYKYTPTTPKRDTAIISNIDDLYATLPAGAVRLETKLEQYESLEVTMDIVGSKVAQSDVFSRSDLQGNCEYATHVVSEVTVGAFELFAMAGLGGKVGGGVADVGIGAGLKREKILLTRDGDPSACFARREEMAEPPPHCSALIRIVVVPIRSEEEALALRTDETDRSSPDPSLLAKTVRVPPGEAYVHWGHGEANQVRGKVDEFQIEQTLVTNGQYSACIDAGACSVPASGSNCNWDREPGTLPVNCVTYNQASEYCQWAGRRLPTPKEWWRAAFGQARSWDKSGTKECTILSNDYSPVGSEEQWRGTYGLYDIHNNGDEWLSGECVKSNFPNGMRWKPNCALSVFKNCKVSKYRDSATINTADGSSSQHKTFRCVEALP